MILIGLCGTIGAGKGTVSEYLVDKYGFKVVTMGDLVRNACEQAGMEPNRENCQKLQKQKIQENGMDYWTRQVIKAVRENGWERAIFDGVRYPHDVEIPREEFGDEYKVVLVDADNKIRFERLQKRARVGDPETLEQFTEQEKKEQEFFGLDKTIGMKDFVIYNDNDMPALYEQVDKLMEQLKVDRSQG